MSWLAVSDDAAAGVEPEDAPIAVEPDVAPMVVDDALASDGCELGEAAVTCLAEPWNVVCSREITPINAAPAPITAKARRRSRCATDVGRLEREGFRVMSRFRKLGERTWQVDSSQADVRNPGTSHQARAISGGAAKMRR
jgi:hypothetical protein